MDDALSFYTASLGQEHVAVHLFHGPEPEGCAGTVGWSHGVDIYAASADDGPGIEATPCGLAGRGVAEFDIAYNGAGNKPVALDGDRGGEAQWCYIEGDGATIAGGLLGVQTVPEERAVRAAGGVCGMPGSVQRSLVGFSTLSARSHSVTMSAGGRRRAVS